MARLTTFLILRRWLRTGGRRGGREGLTCRRDKHPWSSWVVVEEDRRWHEGVIKDAPAGDSTRLAADRFPSNDTEN